MSQVQTPRQLQAGWQPEAEVFPLNNMRSPYFSVFGLRKLPISNLQKLGEFWR